MTWPRIKIDPEVVGPFLWPELAASLARIGREYESAVAAVVFTLDVSEEEAGRWVRGVYAERPVRSVADAADLVIAGARPRVVS